MQEDLYTNVIEAGSARDRARGTLLGLAVGDAVGTTVEFQATGTFEPLNDMVGGGPFHLEPGQWTDDTSMALCLAESLLDRHGHDPVDQLGRYVRWWKEGYFASNGRCFDIGFTTRRQLERFVRSGNAEDPHVEEEASANGSLMRLAPVAIRWSFAPHDVTGYAAASSRTTHPARRPVDTCRVLAAMTAALIRGEEADEVLSAGFWGQEPLHPAVEAVARGSWRTKEPPEIRGSGYCVDALEASLWVVAGAADFREAILRAANLGDDADTTAAIAGQLAGARFGESGIPDEWLDRLAMRTRIESLADGLHSAALGEPLSWGFDGSHHAWWGEPGNLLAGEYPGKRDPARTELSLALLADAGVDTIIDLTHEDDDLAPYGERWVRLGAARRRDLRRFHFPIPDVSVVDERGYRAIVTRIERELDAGRLVYVHCWGGVGRAGTVVGTWLRHRGVAGGQALTAIQTARAGTRKASCRAPQTPEQRAVVRNFVSWSQVLSAAGEKEEE